MAIFPEPTSLWCIVASHRRLPQSQEANKYTSGEAKGDGLYVGDIRASLPSSSSKHCYSGMFLLVGSTVSFLLAMTWGGIRFPWSSSHVLAPLIIGAIGIIAFFAIEALLLKRPTVPPFLFTSRTTLSG